MNGRPMGLSDPSDVASLILQAVGRGGAGLEWRSGSGKTNGI